MPIRAAIGLGSNLGDRKAHLTGAGRAIAARVGKLVASSSLWETAPVGGPEQGAFLNAVVVVETDLPALAVLDQLLEIEREHGRERRERWGPRTLDLDLLLYGDHVIERPGLTVPHPRLAERRFVLEPLVEVWPDATLPDGTVVASFLSSVGGQDVTKVRSVEPVSGAAIFVTVAALALVMWWLLDLVLK